MRRFILFMGIGVLVTFQARAEPASVASVETLLALTKTDRVLDAAYANLEQGMAQGMRSATAGRAMTPEQQRLIQIAPAKIAAVMRSELNWASLRPVLIPVYVETFDQAEVDELLAFYRSPAGHKFVDKQPVLVQKTGLAMQEFMKSVLPKMQSAMQEALREAGVN